jgi:phosphoglycolate phosphatase
MSKSLIDSAELVIFDWDGTLIDSHDYIIDTMLIAAEGSKLELPTREEVSSIIGMSMAPAIKTLFPHMNDEEIVSFRSIYTEHYNNKQRSQPSLFEGVHDILSELKNLDKKMAIATGKRKAGLMSGLEETKSHHFFEELRTADDCASKPSPEMVLSILKATSIAPENTVVIGDNVLDIKMAKAASANAIGVETGSSSQEEMHEAGADACFSSFVSIYA